MRQVTIFFLNAVYIRTMSCPGPRCYAVLYFVLLCNKKAKAPGSALFIFIHFLFIFWGGGGGGGAGLGDWVWGVRGREEKTTRPVKIGCVTDDSALSRRFCGHCLRDPVLYSG